MVVLFPGTKDQSWRWQTTNADYGRFYLALSSEALGVRCRHDELHSECNKKCEALSRQLYELRAELERLRIGGRLQSPRDGCRSPQAHNGDCNFATKARMPCDDMFHTTHDIDYNGGQRTEPQILVDHLKADHPRLVRRHQAANPLGTSCFQKEGDGHQSEQKVYGLGPTPIYWTKGGTTPDGGTHPVHSSPGSPRQDGDHGRPPPPFKSEHHATVKTTQSNTSDYGAAKLKSSNTSDYGAGHKQGVKVGEYPKAPDTASDGGRAAIVTRRIVAPKPAAAAAKVVRSPRAVVPSVERSSGGGGGGEGVASRNQGGGGVGGGGGGAPQDQIGGQGGYGSDRSGGEHHAPHISLKSGGPQRKILPPSQRYNFYRYFGFAGQGAKTSRGWNPK